MDGRVLVFGGGEDFDVGHTAEIYDPATGAWNPAGRPAFARDNHTAILLEDGRVLVSGGIVGDYDPDWEFPAGSSPELYDPASNTWTLAGDESIDYDKVAVLLPNGDVLVAGGYSVRSFFDRWGHGEQSTRFAADLFHLATGSWSKAAAPRLDHPIAAQATRLLDGRVLFTGAGFSNLGGQAEIYDATAADPWTISGAMGVPRYGHTATLLADGNVLVVGGLSINGTGGQHSLASAELYVVSRTSDCGNHYILMPQCPAPD